LKIVSELGDKLWVDQPVCILAVSLIRAACPADLIENKNACKSFQFTGIDIF
jgi:hypothetical protein